MRHAESATTCSAAVFSKIICMHISNLFTRNSCRKATIHFINLLFTIYYFRVLDFSCISGSYRRKHYLDVTVISLKLSAVSMLSGTDRL